MGALRGFGWGVAGLGIAWIVFVAFIAATHGGGVVAFTCAISAACVGWTTGGLIEELLEPDDDD